MPGRGARGNANGGWLGPYFMKRQLRPKEYDTIVKAVAARDRVKAKSIYLSATEALNRKSGGGMGYQKVSV